jgi:subtilase family serine protease
MKLQSSMLRNSLFLLVLTLAFPAFRAAAQTKPDSAATAQSAISAAPVPARVTQAIDETQLVRLKGNVHPLARPEFDQGIAPADLPAQRLLLVLKRSPDQESALAQLLLDQQNKSSASFHNWLTPEQFGAEFGLADKDIQTIVSWLQMHGFQVGRIAKGKNLIEFSVTAGQIREAFHTEIHKYVVNGKAHWANSGDPQIPSALAETVRGPMSLTTFRPKHFHHDLGAFTRSRTTGLTRPVNPEFSTGPTSNNANSFAIGPNDWATIYNVAPLWTAGTDGTGQTIAVVGVSNINLQDVTDFRNLFGLPTTAAANTPTVVIDGSDPGIINDGSETEALLDVEWSGAIAKNAQIDFVIAADSDLGIGAGLSLAMFRVIEDNVAPVMSVSFGACETDLGTSGTQGLSGMWEQAAAQGITVVVSSGDSGASGCEDNSAPPPNPATTGLVVSGFSSSPFNVAVGGTDFNDATNPLTYFKSAAQQNQATLESAIGYIPETTWNDTCTNAIFNTITGLTTPEANCNSSNQLAKESVITVGGGGGVSLVNPKPAYQSFTGLTGSLSSATMRAVPDISLFAGDGFIQNFYAICEADATPAPSCTSDANDNINFFGLGGTSAGTPSFAGVMALVNQKTGQRQGIANFVLYKLAQTQFAAGTACNSATGPNSLCTFNDVTTGTIAMPCAKSSTNCNPTTGTDTIGVLSGFSSGTGYDSATGLGSINAKNLVNNWSTAATSFTPTTTTLSITPTTGIAAGATVTVNITVTPGSGTAKPSGDVGLVSTAVNGQGVDSFTLDSTGRVVSGTTDQLTGGTYTVKAHYDGDGTFAPSDSTPVTVTVSKSSSTTQAFVLASLGAGNFAVFTSGQAPVTLFLEADLNPNGTLLPTGTVNFVDTVNGVPTTVASNVPVSGAFEAFTVGGISTFGAGNHSIVANYSGDASFTASSSPAVTFTLTATTNAPSITSLSPASGSIGTSVTIAGANFGATQSTSTVKFNGTTATPTSWSATSIVVSVPTGATTGSVVVTVGGVASNGKTFTVTSSGSFSISGTAATVTTATSASGATASGTSTITLTPTGGFASAVAITCETVPGVTCSPLNMASGTTTGTLTVNVLDPSTSMTAMAAPATQYLWAANAPMKRESSKGWWTLSGGTGFAAIFLLFLPGRKRLRASLGLGLLCVLSFTLGCGGYSAPGGGGGGGGTATTTTKLTLSTTKVAVNGSITVSATVTSTGTAPAGTVTFSADGTALGSAVPLTSGSTGNITVTAAQAPTFLQLVGTHKVTARYSGDTYTAASSAGTLNVTITGTTQLPIAGNPASSNASPTISLTIN